MLDHTVLPGNRPLLRRLGLRGGRGQQGWRGREHGGIIKLRGLIVKLGGQKVELGRGQVATRGGRRGLGLRRGWELLRAPVGGTLGRQQAIKSQAGLGGCFDVQQGIMGGQQTVGSWAKCRRVLQG